MNDHERVLGLLKRAGHVWDTMSPQQRFEMEAAQRKSWLRAFQPCEHGVVDFEECKECRA
jgi:hypothetical protein